MLRVPTEADWGTPDADDLDASYAHGVFFGKTTEEARLLFGKNALERAEDLQFMPAVPFQYYVFAFRDFVLSDEARVDDCDAADAASSFLRLLEWRLETDPGSVMPVLDDLLPAVDVVARDQGRYGADIEIYGDFAAQAERIRVRGGRRTRR